MLECRKFVEDGVAVGLFTSRSAVSCGKPTGVSGRLPDWVVGVEADRLLSRVSVASEGAVVCVGDIITGHCPLPRNLANSSHRPVTLFRYSRGWIYTRN